MEFIDNKHLSINRQRKRQGIFLILSKLFYALFLIYYGWFQMVFFNITNMSSILGSAIILFILLHALIHRISILRGITSELLVWSIFVITSLSTGIIVAVNSAYLISSIMNFIQYLILIFAMTYISSQDHKINYFVNSYIFFAILCAITTIFWGFSYSYTRITMSESTNPNTLGIIMVIGLFCVLYHLDFNKVIHTLFQFGIVFLFLYIIILTGSIKSLLSALILVVFWIFFVRKDIFGILNKNKILKKLLFFILFVTVLFVIRSIFIESGAYIRLQRLFNEGVAIRKDMYLVAFELFKERPFVGIGFENYRVVSRFQTYSHSTYAEVLACTGLIGTILYFIPYATILYKITKIRKSKNLTIKKDAKLMSGLFLVLLFLGTGIIHFYSVYSSIAFGLIIIFCNLHLTRNTYYARKVG